MESHSSSNLAIPFYVPNLIGYARLVLIIAAHHIKDESPETAVLLYAIFAACDGIDGYAARKLNQCSSFGAWLDVIIDNIGRTLIWSNFKWGLVVANLEWITYVCNHCHGAGWREQLWKDSFANAPVYVRKVMAKGFKTPYGILAVGGLHVLPIWMFGWDRNVFKSHLSFLPSWIPISGFIILLSGRILCALVELWCVKVHLKCLLMTTSETKNQTK
ncbi:hypothetical protein OUZ56_026635 [Daphnia magna]|uniref:CDP-diacylglycerol--inositol 3-phosphatidyltransferase n=1 Tax=Daphnia magna TaxID=35525 RepID=A0ABQ9ZMB9_9CRUS|nr:hypothetical protein OUZ56_026635 [Daphnia magna]